MKNTDMNTNTLHNIMSLLRGAMGGGGLKRTSKHQEPPARGYLPNKLIRLKKWLRDEKRALEIFESKPGVYRMKNMEKKHHMENRIKELEEEIENYGE